MPRVLFLVATVFLSVNTGLVAANLFVGRAFPWQATVLYGTVFILGAAVSAGAAIGLLYQGDGRNRVLDAAIATLPGMLLVAVWLPIYLRDDLHALVVGDFSPRVLLGTSLLMFPAAGVAIWESRQQESLVASIGGSRRYRIRESLDRKSVV